jgi:lipoprotein-anchoring transpeptidase ErfK/SrfK
MRAALAAVTAALVLPATAAAQEPQTLTLALAPATVVYGSGTTATGSLAPAQEGIAVVVERSVGDSWETLATATTDAAGAFSAPLAPTGGGAVQARVVETGTASGALFLSVLPRLVLDRSPGRAFLGAPLRVDVQPASYTGAVVVTTRRDGRVLGRVRVRVREGRLRVLAPTPGVGRFAVRLAFPAVGALSGRTLTTSVRSTARRLSVGSRGVDVRALHRRLAELRFHVPGLISSFGHASFDAVIAFQKARRLPRTGVVGPATWNALGLARVPRPRFAAPSPHIEVDKTRQILLVVRGGRVVGILPVSTGATGNTPEGAFRILWKAPATSTWLGAGTLYRTLTFHGNFAIHGWASVPPYPASHGCVRVPIWAADWLYRQSPVGERVFVYR